MTTTELADTGPSELPPLLHERLDIDLVDLLMDPTHPGWSHDTPMPKWLTSFRTHQVIAIAAIMDAFTRTDTVILDAPVGSGKTVIADMVRRILGADSIYLATTKTLQDQFVQDFPQARVLKGRANYPTAMGPYPEVTASDCTKSPTSDCMWCPEAGFCPYNQAKLEALQARTAVLNNAYFLTEANHVGRFAGRPFAVADEADLMEGSLMGFVEVEVSAFWQRLMRIKPPKRKTEASKSNDWIEWSQYAIQQASAYVANLPNPRGDVKKLRHRKRATNLLAKLIKLAEQLPDGGWVYDGYDRGKASSIIFKPIMVREYGQDMMWRHANRWLLMSGSVISPSEMAHSLGIDSWEAVTVNTGWDPRRRPVWVAPVANVTWKDKKEAYPAVCDGVLDICNEWPDERILVHGVSYVLTKEIIDYLRPRLNGRPLFTYTKASEREDALQGYLETPGAIIVAPSLDRGVDFKDDRARVQIVCKVPYPSLGDKQVSARRYMGRMGAQWFAANTVRGFVQMIGRGMRHENDWCVTYVLDRQLQSNILKRNRAMIPGWLMDALLYGDRPWERRELHPVPPREED